MPLPPGTHAYDPLWPGLTWEDDNTAYPASAERLSQVSDQVKGLTARVSGGALPVNAKDYGLGDGITTAAAAIQAAYTAAAGRRVFIPRGTWDLGTSQITGSYVPRFIGEGCHDTVLTHSGAAPFNFTGSTGSTKALTADATIGDSQLLFDTTGIAVGDILLLKSTADWTAGEAGSKQGEFVLVETVDSAGQVTISGHIVDTYTTANTATVAKVSFLVGPSLEGIGFQNLNYTSSAQSVFGLTYALGFKGDNVAFDSSVGASIALASCLDWLVHDASFKHGRKDYGGAHTYAYGYGVIARGACAQGVVSDSRIQDGHALFTAEGSGQGGIPRNILVTNSEAWGDVEIPFHTHAACEFITFDGCRVYGSGQKAVNKAYGPGFYIAGKRCSLNIPVANDVGGAAIYIDTTADDTSINSPDVNVARDAGTTLGRGINNGGTNTKVNGGQIRGCTNAGIVNNSSGMRVEGTYIKAGGTAGSMYPVIVNDASDTGQYYAITAEGADEAIHFITPASPSPCVRDLRTISCAKKTNKPGALIASSGETNALMLMGA